LRAGFMSLVLAVGLTLPAMADTLDYLYVQVPHMVVREAASEKSKEIGLIDIGTLCTQRVATRGDWASIDCEGVSGFARRTSLGAKEPDAKALAAQAQDPKQTIAQRYAAARRLVAIEYNAGLMNAPGAPARAEFRERYLDRAFARLAERRAAKKLLAKPIISVQTAADPDAAIAAAVASSPLTRHGELVATKVARRGSDFVVTALASTGRLVVLSGNIAKAAKGATVTVELRSAASAPAEIFLAVLDPVGTLPVTCESQPTTAEGEPLCMVEYEQNCSPDNCWEPFQDCKATAGAGCRTCAESCTASCDTCHVACAGKPAGCVAACLSSATKCRASCGKGITKGVAACDKTYSSCAKKAEKWANTHCPGECRKYERCVESNCASDTDDGDCKFKCVETSGLSGVCREKCGP
jgi:hypothetical protein